MEYDKTVPAGYRGALYIKNVALEKMKYQNEVLFHRGFKYTVESVEIIEGNYYLRGKAL